MLNFLIEEFAFNSHGTIECESPCLYEGLVFNSLVKTGPLFYDSLRTECLDPWRNDCFQKAWTLLKLYILLLKFACDGRNALVWRYETLLEVACERGGC